MACMKLHSIFLQRNRHVIISLLAFAFLLMSSLTPFQFMAQDNSPGSLVPIWKDQKNSVKMRSLVGSRPPRCDQRCRSCGHCEAVQVPIAPTIKFLKQEIYATPRIAYSRGDDISNYKPMCWKCKCGDFIFNP
ncbi:hypothetical protein Pfo_021873 [Paulownia fortunei]|nr:hypothetical protein Pfo_021873 [Paulownia fortunei]